MATATARARTPDKRKGRTATVRPLQNFHNNGTNSDSITALRRQRLAAFGLSNIRADLIASLAWGV